MVESIPREGKVIDIGSYQPGRERESYWHNNNTSTDADHWTDPSHHHHQDVNLISDSPPLCSPVLEPGFHLSICHLQIFRHLRSLSAGQIFLNISSSNIFLWLWESFLPVYGTVSLVHISAAWRRMSWVSFSLEEFCSDKDDQCDAEEMELLKQNIFETIFIKDFLIKIFSTLLKWCFLRKLNT